MTSPAPVDITGMGDDWKTFRSQQPTCEWTRLYTEKPYTHLETECGNSFIEWAGLLAFCCPYCGKIIEKRRCTMYVETESNVKFCSKSGEWKEFTPKEDHCIVQLTKEGLDILVVKEAPQKFTGFKGRAYTITEGEVIFYESRVDETKKPLKSLYLVTPKDDPIDLHVLYTDEKVYATSKMGPMIVSQKDCRLTIVGPFGDTVTVTAKDTNNLVDLIVLFSEFRQKVAYGTFSKAEAKEFLRQADNKDLTIVKVSLLAPEDLDDSPAE